MLDTIAASCTGDTPISCPMEMAPIETFDHRLGLAWSGRVFPPAAQSRSAVRIRTRECTYKSDLLRAQRDFDGAHVARFAMMSETGSKPYGLLSRMRMPLITIDPIWQSNTSSGRVSFSCRAPATVTILNVDPGS